MDVQDLAEYARQRYNAVGDEFFSDAELYRHIWAAQNILATKCRVIERLYTTTTVASQQEYSFPTNTIAIKRITYDGQKLMPITFREDDTLTLNNSTTAATGTPQYYSVWSRTLYLRPVPDSALTLEIFSYNAPQEVTSSSVLEVPEVFHLDLADYLLWMMSEKDKNTAAADRYRLKWEQAVKDAMKWQRMSKRGDGFVSVQDLDLVPTTIIGAV